MKIRPWRVLVCGTRFGRVYLSALANPAFRGDHALVGILAAGSERSRRCAEMLGVPLFTDVGQLGHDIDAACVAIRAEVSGGPGSRIAERLLERGVHVLQEHPIHHDELARLLRVARQNAVVHRMNTFYPHLRTVRQFISAAARLLHDHPALWIDGVCSVQYKISFLDIIGRTLGRLRPWSFQALPAGERGPFRSIQGVIGGVPITFRLQNQVHGSDPDNHAHVFHQICIGTDAGSLTLADTHGPILWRPRPHVPLEIQNDESPMLCKDPALDNRTTSLLTGAPPAWRHVMADEWPAAVGRALAQLQQASRGEPVKPDVQYDLSLLKMVSDLDLVVGPPEVVWAETPHPGSETELAAAIADAS